MGGHLPIPQNGISYTNNEMNLLWAANFLVSQEWLLIAGSSVCVLEIIPLRPN